MLKKLTTKMLFLLIIANISIATTNRELYNLNNKNEKNIYRKYDAISGNTEIISNNLTNDLIVSSSLFYENEMDKILNLIDDKKEIKKINKAYGNSQNVIISIMNLNKSLFPKKLLGYEYVNQNKSTLATVVMEAHLFSFNTYFEYSNNKESFIDNSDFIYEYLYFKGTSMTEEELKKLNSQEIEKELAKKYTELDKQVESLEFKNEKDKKEYIKNYRKSIDELKSDMNNFNNSYSELIEESTYENDIKDKLLIFPKYQMIMNLTFFITELKEGL